MGKTKIKGTSFGGGNKIKRTKTLKTKQDLEDQKMLRFFDDSTWVTVLIDNNQNVIEVYKGRGLDYERDKIDPEDVDDQDVTYMEMEGEQLLDLYKNDKDKRINWRFMKI